MADRADVAKGYAIALLTAGALLGGCTSAVPGEAGPSEEAPPPPPPAACVLDTAQLATATGITWTPDQTTASDTRCVYDPGAGGAQGNDFLAVDVTPAPAADVATALDTVAEVCVSGSRTAAGKGGSGFVCRFEGGSVYGALVRGGQLLTVGASAVPEGTTDARLTLGVSQQLGTLSGG